MRLRARIERGLMERKDHEHQNAQPENNAAVRAEDLETQTDASEAVEPILPTDFFQEGKKKKSRKKRKPLSKTARALLFALGVILLAAICACAVYLNKIINDPSALFPMNPSLTPTPSPEALYTPDPALSVSASPEPTAEPTVDPYEELYEQADISMMQNIVNILVIGVDNDTYREDSDAWTGKSDWHADVLMVIAVNFDENTADLISIPRDTYVKVPGVNGIYKINGSLNCGGGLYAEGGAGFLKCCETVSWMLGGIPVDYYYAVTMDTVKALVNAIGGVEYDLEYTYHIAGRSYTKGLQTLDGQGVLDYMRVRKSTNGLPSSATSDLKRINRQKQMMIAIFKQMQKTNLISTIPDLVSEFTANDAAKLYTNCDITQTAALALFAYKLSSDDIGMYSMDGAGLHDIFGWNFCLTDQSKRVSIIEEVYGVSMARYMAYSPTYAWYRWARMQSDNALEQVEPLTKYVQKLIDADDLLPTATPEPSETPEASATPDATAAAPGEPTATPAPTATPDTGSGTQGEGGASGTAYRGGGFTVQNLSSTRREPDKTQVYTEEQRKQFTEYLEAVRALEDAITVAQKQADKYLDRNSNSLTSATAALNSALSDLKAKAESLAKTFGYSTGKLNWDVVYWRDRSFNSVIYDWN